MNQLTIRRQVFDGKTDVIDGRSPKRPGHSMGPRVVERDTVDGGQQVDAVWRHAELHDFARRREVVNREPETPEAEVRQRAQQPFSVVWRWFDDWDVM